MMTTHEFCRSLDMLERKPAINAIHEAWLQLTALTDNVDCEDYDNKPAIASLEACLSVAGHVGFPDAKPSRHVGGSVLASNCKQVLEPIKCPAGTLQVRVMIDLDSHVLVITHEAGTSTIAEHPNGYSCHVLAQHIAAGDADKAVKQAEHIRQCGGMTRDDGAIRYHAEQAKADAS